MSDLVAQRFTAVPWDWRPATTRWFDDLAQEAAHWQPTLALELDRRALIDALCAAANRRERWILHPCINALTSASCERRLQRDLQLAVWIATNTADALGHVTVLETTRIWSAAAGLTIKPGVHGLDELGERMSAGDWPLPIAFDAWALSVSTNVDQSWSSREPDPFEVDTLEREAICFLRALKGAQTKLGAMYDWITTMTQVVVPLRRVGGRYSKSSSSRTLPGLAFLTIHDEIQVLEALVHETAHNYLFLAERFGAFVDPRHNETYHSPLRLEPRPLLGVLLAYHALAYICAFYRDAMTLSAASRERCVFEFRKSFDKLLEAERTLKSGKAHLTRTGVDFFEQTSEIAEYGKANVDAAV